MRSTQPAVRRTERIAYAAARGLAPAQKRRVAGFAFGAATSASSVSPTEGNPGYPRGASRGESEKPVPGSRPVPAIARRRS
jgi:hypothetical protein